MNQRTTLTLTTLLLALPAVLQAAHVTHLRCEYRENPLGIELVKPQLGWVIEGGGRESNVTGQKQTADQVLVASSEPLLKNDQGDLWDSGKVASDQSVLVVHL